MTEESATYKNPACESGIGNLSVDADMVYTLTGAEAADTTILMRKMSGRNQYLRIKLFMSAAMGAGTLVDIGYVARETGESDDLDALGDGIDVVAASVVAFDGIVKVPFKHDIALTIKANNAANDGRTITLRTEFVNASG